MPYVYDPSLDPTKQDPNDPQQQGPQLAGGSQVVGGGSNTQAPGGGAKPQGQTSSDRFQNLNDYLSANQGTGFGQQFAGKVGEDVNKAYTAQDQASNQFKGMSDAATTKYDSDLVGKAVSDPTNFAKDQSNVDAFAKQRDAAYKGPNSFADASDVYNQAAGATQKARNVADQANKESGRFALLDNYFGRPQYSQGQKSLDQLLVQGDSGAQAGIKQARDNAQNAQTAFQTQSDTLGNYAAGNRATSEDTAKQTRGALGIDANGNYVEGQGAIGSTLGQLDTEVAARQKALQDQQALLSTIGTAKGTSNLSPAQLKALGISSDLGAYASTNVPKDFLNNNIRTLVQTMPTYGQNSFFGVDPSKYLNYTPTESINRGSVASTDEAGRLNALTQLSNLSGPLVGNLDQAGTQTNGPLSTFDQAGFNTARGNQMNAFGSELNQIYSDYNTAKAKAAQSTAESGIAGGGPNIADYRAKIAALQSRYGA